MAAIHEYLLLHLLFFESTARGRNERPTGMLVSELKRGRSAGGETPWLQMYVFIPMHTFRVDSAHTFIRCLKFKAALNWFAMHPRGNSVLGIEVPDWLSL